MAESVAFWSQARGARVLLTHCDGVIREFETTSGSILQHTDRGGFDDLTRATELELRKTVAEVEALIENLKSFAGMSENVQNEIFDKHIVLLQRMVKTILMKWRTKEGYQRRIHERAWGRMQFMFGDGGQSAIQKSQALKQEVEQVELRELEVKDTHQATHNRHEAIQKIDSDIGTLQTIFKDFSDLVNVQDEPIHVMEENINATVEDARAAGQDRDAALKLQRRAGRKKKLLIGVYSVISLVVALGLSLGIYFVTRKVSSD